MTDDVKLLYTARSRAPIDQTGVEWWKLYGEKQIDDRKLAPKGKHIGCKADFKQNSSLELKSNDKSTNTEKFTTHETDFLNLPPLEMFDPKDFVLKKWREKQSKEKFEHARRAIVMSIKEKFENQAANPGFNAEGHKAGGMKDVPMIIITNADVEDTSNLNANRGKGTQTNLNFVFDGGKVEIDGEEIDSVGHAMEPQMGPGCELAQWRFAIRGSRAAGAVGRLRGQKLEMPILDVSGSNILVANNNLNLSVVHLLIDEEGSDEKSRSSRVPCERAHPGNKVLPPYLFLLPNSNVALLCSSRRVRVPV